MVQVLQEMRELRVAEQVETVGGASFETLAIHPLEQFGVRVLNNLSEVD